MKKKVYEYIFQDYDEETSTKDTLVDMETAYGDTGLWGVRAGVIEALSHRGLAPYLDPYGLIHTVENEEDSIFSYVFVVEDNDWQSVVETMEVMLSVSLTPSLPESARACFKKVRDAAIEHVEKEEEIER